MVTAARSLRKAAAQLQRGASLARTTERQD
jgi:hypothetical protein